MRLGRDQGKRDKARDLPALGAWAGLVTVDAEWICQRLPTPFRASVCLRVVPERRAYGEATPLI